MNFSTQIKNLFCCNVASSSILFLLHIGVGFAAGEDELAKPERPRLTTGALQQFVNEFEQQRRFYHIPGAAMAIVQNNKVILARGFGVRKLGEKKPVTAETLFNIGSINKSMTAMMAGSLVDDGYFNWDTPLNQLMPQFRVADDAATQNITLRHTFSQSSGLPALTLETFLSGLSPQEINQHLHAVIPEAPAGRFYRYSNTMFSIGAYGTVMAVESDDDEKQNLVHEYKELFAKRILQPIGMTHSGLSSHFIGTSANHATPYLSRLNGNIAESGLTLTRAEFWDLGFYAPAGSVRSNVLDMSRYLLTLLNRGVSPDGHQVIAKHNLEELFQPQIKIPSAPPFDSASYGLGWVNIVYQGVPVLTHDGQIGGFSATIALLPQANLGIVILNNTDEYAGSRFNLSVQYRLFEMLYDLPPRITGLFRTQYLEVANQASAFYQRLKPIDTAMVSPFIGSYPLWGKPYRLQLRNHRLWLLRGDVDLTELLLGPEQRYYGVSGMFMGFPIELITEPDGRLAMRIGGKRKLYQARAASQTSPLSYFGNN